MEQKKTQDPSSSSWRPQCGPKQIPIVTNWAQVESMDQIEFCNCDIIRVGRVRVRLPKFNLFHYFYLIHQLKPYQGRSYWVWRWHHCVYEGKCRGSTGIQNIPCFDDCCGSPLFWCHYTRFLERPFVHYALSLFLLSLRVVNFNCFSYLVYS